MLKSALLKKTVCLTTIFSFVLASLSKNVYAYGYRLAPESFEEMYALAKSGRVEALRASVNRGLNIDVMNSDGDTGLCVAARRHDSYAYNAFRAAGANPRHPCTQNIYDYEEFTTSSRAVPVTATPRAAYSTIGKESYGLSPKIWWWLGGAALIGGVAALAMGGGGSSSDGGSSSGGGDDNPDTEEYTSLGATVGTSGVIKKSVSGSLSDNSTYYEHKNTKTEEIAKIDLNSDILSNTKYLDVILNAKNGGTYRNTTDTVLKAGDGVVAMSAVGNSKVSNSGFINIDSYNAGIGMVASESSTAVNNGQGIGDGTSNNGIALNFSGYDASHTLIGMYADTKSELQNSGDIKGTAIKTIKEAASSSETTDSSSDVQNTSSSATSGTLVGMEAMIINDGKDLNKNTTSLRNESSGKISLSAGDSGSTDDEIKVSLIGMGSFLDNGFMTASKDINRAEKVDLSNSGNIALAYTGKYTADSETSLRKGTGGIIGMRADANTTACNYASGSINLDLDEYSAESSSIDVSAGMQSVHGGNLYNHGNINITTSAGNARKNYGMLSVEGSGNVSGLYSGNTQTLSNSGNINIQASNSFGIASFNGGSLKNSGNIVLGKQDTTTQYQKNIAMYGYGKTKETSMENTGTIDIYSHDSVAMQNDFAGGTSIYNKGTINVHESATNSYVFGGAYSEAHNSDTINYYANSDGTASSEGTKINPFANYKISIGNSVISTAGKSVLEDTSSTSSSTTEKIYNDEGATINVEGSSFIAALYVEKNKSDETTQGKAENNGTINISDSAAKNATNAVGMYLGENSLNNAGITNNGTISTNSKFSAAMASSSSKNASVVNNGAISADKAFSLGVYAADFTNILNSGTIGINGDYSVGIYTTGNTGSSTVINEKEKTINIGSGEAFSKYSYGIYADGNSWHNITNSGTINTYTKERGAAIYSAAADNTDEKENTVTNKGTINVFGNNAYGIYVENDIYVTNEENASINIGTEDSPVSKSYGIYSAFEADEEDYEPKGEIVNNGTINVYSAADDPSYGIFSGGTSIKNKGTIKVTNGNGIYATNPSEIINSGNISITQNGNGIYVVVTSADEKVTIKNTGTIGINDNSGYQIYVVKNYELTVTETTNADGETIRTYTDNTTIENGTIKGKEKDTDNNLVKEYDENKKTRVVYTGTCFPHCINGETEEVSDSSSASAVSMALSSSGNSFRSIAFNNTGSSLEHNVENKQVAQILQQNSSTAKGERVLKVLKSAADSVQLNRYVNKELGFDMVPNLNEQNFEVEKTVGSELNDDLISPTNENSRRQVKITAYNNEVNSKQNIVGYKNKVIAAYGFADKAVNNKLRLGFGLSAIRFESEFDDDSSRYNNMLEISTPLIFHNNNMSALFKPKAGFARGHYRRMSVNQVHKAKTKDFYYGFDSAVRQRFDVDYAVLEPNAGFNFTGIYNDDVKESGNGLHLKDNNIISAPVYLGLDIRKKFVFDERNSLSLTIGGKYFHELGKKDSRRASIDDMDGYYDITDGRLQRDYGLLSLKAVYTHKNFTVSASANAPLKQKNEPYYLIGLGYTF